MEETKEIETKAKEETVATYDKNARAFADKFNVLPSKMESDINFVYSLVKKKNPITLEIGCANGRDAKKIVKHTSKYTGIDLSSKLLMIAKTELPELRFELHDIENFDIPEGLDVVFAFASLLHTPKETLKIIFEKLYLALNNGGIFFFTLKYSLRYDIVRKEDSFGVRTFYLYGEEDLRYLQGDFVVVKESKSYLQDQEWLDICLKKQV